MPDLDLKALLDHLDAAESLVVEARDLASNELPVVGNALDGAWNELDDAITMVKAAMEESLVQ